MNPQQTPVEDPYIFGQKRSLTPYPALGCGNEPGTSAGVRTGQKAAQGPADIGCGRRGQGCWPSVPVARWSVAPVCRICSTADSGTR
ncbi:hypothetical protein ACFFX0_12145 [Citricoccus parietis]|uniref:Uncharacterized protein n=1 Tax=Citricoccus parietis TaxID=592307 RepID=A0ABV5FZ08_9MICC